jgi:hypothetical protein
MKSVFNSGQMWDTHVALEIINFKINRLQGDKSRVSNGFLRPHWGSFQIPNI